MAAAFRERDAIIAQAKEKVRKWKAAGEATRRAAAGLPAHALIGTFSTEGGFDCEVCRTQIFQTHLSSFAFLVKPNRDVLPLFPVFDDQKRVCRPWLDCLDHGSQDLSFAQGCLQYAPALRGSSMTAPAPDCSLRRTAAARTAEARAAAAVQTRDGAQVERLSGRSRRHGGSARPRRGGERGRGGRGKTGGTEEERRGREGRETEARADKTPGSPP